MAASCGSASGALPLRTEQAYLKTTENLYLAAGLPKVMTKINLLQLILMAVLIYPLTLTGTGYSGLE